MIFKESLVAFMDILGFSQMIHDYESSGEEKVVEILSDTFHKAISLFDKNNLDISENDFIRVWKDNMGFKAFSDCICVFVPVEEIPYPKILSIKLFLQYVGIFQTVMLLLGKGYLIRGGISIGKLYVDDKIIFSKALIDAYELESKYAIVPRVLISSKLLDIIKSETVNHEEMLTGYPILTQFEDSLKFVNFLNNDLKDTEAANVFTSSLENALPDHNVVNNFERMSLQEKAENLRNCKLNIQEKLANNKYDQSVINKYQWMLRFLENEKQNGLARQAELSF